MKVNHITLGGIFTSLTLITLYSTSLLLVSTISILAVTSFFLAICILKSSIKTGIFVYIASSLVGAFMIPINILLMYILLFGIYAIVKYYIEKLNKFFIEIVLKVLFFNLSLLIAFIVMTFLMGKVITTLPCTLIWIISQLCFFLYDYIFTMIITLVRNKLKI